MDKEKPRLARLTAILTQLQSKRIVTAKDIAEKHNVSIRTVYRDIRTLEKSGIPIVTEEGKGYSVMEGYKIPPNMMNPIQKTVSNINLWNFNNKGFYLYLPAYEESSWMATTRDFTFEEMNEFLTPFGKSLR